MTCAVADAIMNGGEEDNFIDSMKKYGRMYPDAGYGGRFGAWLFLTVANHITAMATALPCAYHPALG